MAEHPAAGSSIAILLTVSACAQDAGSPAGKTPGAQGADYNARQGSEPGSVILKKLVAFPRQNALHRALREMRGGPWLRTGRFRPEALWCIQGR